MDSKDHVLVVLWGIENLMLRRLFSVADAKL